MTELTPISHKWGEKMLKTVGTTSEPGTKTKRELRVHPNNH